MSKYHAEMGFLVTKYGTADDLDTHLDCVLDAMLEDDRAIDPDYTATLETGEVEFSLSVEAEDEANAYGLMLLVIRTAIHTAQGCTPGWEAEFEKVKTMIEKNELQDA